MQIKRTIKGHEFAVQLRAVERAETLGHAEPAYNAHVTIYRDGRDIGSGMWDARGFLAPMPVLPDAHDSDRALRVLATAIGEHLAALPVETRADDATASMQRVTFAPGLRGHELRTMAVNARVFAAGIEGPVGAAWRALADALDAAAEQDEHTARVPAPPPAESPDELTPARRRDLLHVALWDSAKHEFSGAWPSDLSDGGAYLVEQRLAYRANFCGRLHLAPRGRELIASMQAGNAAAERDEAGNR